MQRVAAGLWLVLLGSGLCGNTAAANRVFYSGGADREQFFDIHALSDGTALVAGQARDLNWIAPAVPRTVLPATGIDSAASGQIGFLLHVSADLSQLLRVVSFPSGSVRSVFKIRSTDQPGQTTGTLCISGHRDGATVDGYYLACLDQNFVAGPPTGLRFVHNVSAGGDHKGRQPWDVGGDGRIVYAIGAPFGTEWAAIRRLSAAGQPDLVEHWHAHWTSADTEWDGTPASIYSGAPALAYSAIVMKTSRRGSLRSVNQSEYSLLATDGNGNSGRQGRLPDDYYYNGPCALSGSGTCPNSGPGYTGYRAVNAQTQRVGAIVIDRRNNDLYFGYSTKSVLPDGNPDFEPAIVAMRADGSLKWWDRLYRETTANSSPDQYVDGLAIDHARNRLVVLARAHGNNTINLWNGNSISANPGGSGFQQQFSGTNGNIHLSWLGSYALDSGRVQAASYLGEFNEGANTYGAAHPDPLLGGWPNPNTGWPNLNTTRCGADTDYSGEIAIAGDGAIGVLCVGRRTITTTDAHQQMPRPNQTPMPTGSWNQFVRVYAPDLASLRYSSLLVGAWDTSTGAGGDNTKLVGLAFAAGHVLVAGTHLADASGLSRGNPLPLTGIPGWGSATPLNDAPLLARLTGERLTAPSSPVLFGNGFE